MRLDKVSFCSMPGQCELMAESAINCWIVRFFSDGRQELYLNLKRVEGVGPRSPLRTLVCQCADSLASDIVAYMNAKDTLAGSQLFWTIKGKLEHFNQKGK